MDAKQSTRERILSAALDLFAKHGYSGTRVESITQQARVNKRMLYHYFGSKRGLYEEVARHEFSEVLDRAASVGQQTLLVEGPQSALRLIIQEYFDALLSHPRYVRFLLWEAASNWSTMNGLSHTALDHLRSTIIDILNVGMKEGSFRPGLDVDVTWSYLIGVPAFYFQYRPRMQLYTVDADLSTPEEVQRYREKLISLALNSVSGLVQAP